MGLGPNVMRPGDIVCVLGGGVAPILLRPVDGHFQMVGECYVYGIMEGEAVQQWKMDRGVEEVFEIR